MNEDDDHEIVRVADDIEIRNLLARIAQLSDSGEVDRYVDLFTEEAVWQMQSDRRSGLGGSTLRGKEAIGNGARERRKASLAAAVSNMHFVATTTIDIDGDVATAFSYFQVISVELKLQSAGKYYDQLRRTEDGWKITSRELRFG